MARYPTPCQPGNNWRYFGCLSVGGRLAFNRELRGATVNVRGSAIFFSDGGTFPTHQKPRHCSPKESNLESSRCESVSQDRCNQNLPKRGFWRKFLFFSRFTMVVVRSPPKQPTSPKTGERCEGVSRALIARSCLYVFYAFAFFVKKHFLLFPCSYGFAGLL